MPIDMGDKKFESIVDAVRHIRKNRPDVKDPVSYAMNVQATIQKRREEKAKAPKK